MAAAQNAFTDMFKNFADVSKFPKVDINSSFTAIRRNTEAASTAGQVLAEGVHTATRLGGKILRDNAETAAKATRDLMASSSPEQAAAKQAAYVKDAFENGLSSIREVCELLTKSSLEAFDVLQKRIAESIEETTDTATKKSKK